MTERNPLPDCLSHLAQRDKPIQDTALQGALLAIAAVAQLDNAHAYSAESAGIMDDQRKRIVTAIDGLRDAL